jgi:hypothetical protein
LRTYFNTYNSKQVIPQHDDSKQQNLHASKVTTNKTTQIAHNSHTTPYSKPTTMSSGRKMTMNLVGIQSRYDKRPPGGSRDTPQSSNGSIVPPPVVETVISSSQQSQTSSIVIGEFGMNPARKGNAAAFSMAVKDNLFQKINFYREQIHLWTSAWTPYPFVGTCTFAVVYLKLMPTSGGMTSIMLKSIYTDCRNNKIKMIKQQFNGKLI